MRRALREALPAFSHFFGIHPWQVQYMTFGEIEEYQRQLDSYVKHAKQAAKGR